MKYKYLFLNERDTRASQTTEEGRRRRRKYELKEGKEKEEQGMDRIKEEEGRRRKTKWKGKEVKWMRTGSNRRK